METEIEQTHQAGAAGPISQAPLAGDLGALLLPLDAPERIAVYRSNGKIFRHVFRRITAKDWENFYSLVVAEFSAEKGGFSQVVDTDGASLALYGKIIQRVEGFNVKPGSGPQAPGQKNDRAVESLPFWQERIPQQHRLTAVSLLLRAGRNAAADDSVIEPEGVTVTLDALWESDARNSAMQLYSGLVHKFAQPSAEHRRRMLKAKNRAFVAGGSRSGTTIIPSSHALLVKLYDELIESVDGYSVKGAALTGREQISREMDAVHKAAAVGELFPTSLRVDQDEEKSDAIET